MIWENYSQRKTRLKFLSAKATVDNVLYKESNATCLTCFVILSSRWFWPDWFLSILQMRKHALWNQETCPWLYHQRVAELELETTWLQSFGAYSILTSPQKMMQLEKRFRESIQSYLHRRPFQNQVLKSSYKSHPTMSGLNTGILASSEEPHVILWYYLIWNIRRDFNIFM